MRRAATKPARAKIGELRNGQRLVARIVTWCRACVAWRTLACWRVERRALRIGGKLVQHDFPNFHMLHCETCGHERRLERGHGVTVIEPPPNKR